jgi:hypothetical protein
LTVDGRARLATTMHRSGWSTPCSPRVETLDAPTRRALADLWTKDGLFEHASVASFSRFALQLLSLGAPPELLRQVHVAVADEIEHARLCFGLASAFAGGPVGPGALDLRGALSDESLEARGIAVSLASEGCVAETVSALLVAAARDRARDPAVRAVLARIAREEVEHVALAWEALAWILERGDSTVRSEVRAVFARAHQHYGVGAVTSLPAAPQRLAEYGVLDAAERRELAMDVIERVVRPAATSLLERRGPGTPGERPRPCALAGRATSTPRLRTS